MKESITKYMVQDHMDGEGEKSYLHRQLFNVNMRLYAINTAYYMFINNIISYMKVLFRLSYTDYEALKGVSGANIGIPFNIVVVADEDDEAFITMINPEIISYGDKKKSRKSNCGSLRLDKPIMVERYDKIEVKYYDELGSGVATTFTGKLASTIAHEIDHNNGITIEDRYLSRMTHE